MKPDTKKTVVRFYVDPNFNNEITAYFPKEYYDTKGIFKTCYAHIGQHSACDPNYFRRCRKATPEQYAPLKEELESIGYNLTVK